MPPWGQINIKVEKKAAPVNIQYMAALVLNYSYWRL
jgi:hypothetical protein